MNVSGGSELLDAEDFCNPYRFKPFNRMRGLIDNAAHTVGSVRGKLTKQSSIPMP